MSRYLITVMLAVIAATVAIVAMPSGCKAGVAASPLAACTA